MLWRTMTGRHPGRASRPGVWVFAVVFAVLAVWALASPMFSSPDEPSHMVRSEGLVHGQLSGDVVGKGRAFEVSTMFQEGKSPWADAPCYAFDSDATADCLDVPADDGDHLVRSSAARYPPTFHALAGWPTLLTGGVKSLYLMRLANALVCAALLTTAIRSAALVPGARLVLAGVAIAVTPMVLFVSGTVNPSGIATTAGLAVWTGGVALSRSEVPRSLARSAAACGAPFCLLLLVRRDSLVWGVALLLCLLALFDRERLRTLARSRACWGWALASGTVALFQLVVTTGPSADSFRKAAGGDSSVDDSSVSKGLGILWELLFEAVGVLGWLDTRLPFLAYVVWFGVSVALVLAALAVAPRRLVVALLVTLALLVGLAVTIGAIRHNYLQGRYLLPLAVGIPILGATGVAWRSGDEWVTRRTQWVLLGSLWAMHQLAFGQHLRRYVVGHRGPLDFVVGGGWSPPVVPVWPLLLAHMAATAGLMIVLAGGSAGGLLGRLAIVDRRPVGAEYPGAT